MKTIWAILVLTFTFGVSAVDNPMLVNLLNAKKKPVAASGFDHTTQLVFRAPLTDGSGTTADDVSVNNNNGTLIDAVTFGTGYATSPGTGTSGIDFGNPSIIDGATAMSVSYWFKLNDASGLHLFISKWHSGVEGPFVMFWFAPSEAILAYTVTTGAAVLSRKDGFAGDTTTFHHVVLTYDGTNQRLYFDGVLADTDAQSGGLKTDTNRKLWLFRDDDNANRANCQLKDVRIYTPRVLSGAEVAALYALGANP